MKNKPLVTIGIPTYERPHLLPRALESVAKQTYRPLEVYVVDDGTPGTENEKIVDSFKKKIPGLAFYKNPKNLGFARTYFELVERATGEFFMWMADDDEMSPTYIEAAVETLLMYPEAVSAALQNLMSGTLSIFPPSYMEESWFRRLFSFVVLDYFRNSWVDRFSFFFSVNRTVAYREASRKAAERFSRNPLKCETGADVFLRSELLLLGTVVPVTRRDAAYILYAETEKEYTYAGKHTMENDFFQNQRNKISVCIHLAQVFCMHLHQAYDWGGMRRAVPLGIGLLAVSGHMLSSSLYQQVRGRVNRILGKVEVPV
ncbi:MAG: glycosyltransferase family 2 protein [Holosporales bacterium]|nr:glycosyltransferase family 2 protein [Holosporales bacterium]